MLDGQEAIRVQPRPQRLQFRLIWLFALMTATCLALTWWTWPQSVEVVSLVNASATPLTIAKSFDAATGPPAIVYQQELLDALNDPALLEEAIGVIGSKNLSMLRHRSDPAKWLKSRFAVTAVGGRTISITLTVPEFYQADAVELVDYITLKCFAQVTADASQRIRRYLTAARKEHQSLHRSLDKTCQQIAQFNPGWTSSHPQVAALKEEAARTAASMIELGENIKTAEEAYRQSDTHCQLLQMAKASRDGQ